MKKTAVGLLLGTCLAALSGCNSHPMYDTTPQPGAYSTEDTLTAAVSSALTRNKLLAKTPIQVEAQNGTVILSGYVKTIRQSDTAEAIAAKVPGVKSVENNLIVRK